MLSGVYGGLITSRVTNTWHGDMRANTFFSAVSILLGREPTSSSIFSPRKVWAQHFRIQLLPTSLGLIFTLNLTGVMRPRFGQMFMLKLGLHELSLQCQLWKMRYKACRVQNVCRRAMTPFHLCSTFVQQFYWGERNQSQIPWSFLSGALGDFMATDCATTLHLEALQERMETLEYHLKDRSRQLSNCRCSTQTPCCAICFICLKHLPVAVIRLNNYLW